MLLAIAASRGLILKILDVENCFQNDAIEPDQRIFAVAPPLYLDWFRETYTDIKID